MITHPNLFPFHQTIIIN